MSDLPIAARTSYIERADRLLAVLRASYGVPRSTHTVIAVGGESGCGKSVTAIDLAAVLTDAGIGAAIIHQDDYFIRPPRTNHEHRERDVTSVGPHEVQWDLIRHQITAFRSGAATLIGPVVNYPENRFDTQELDLRGCDVLVVEGTYALLHADADIRIFLEATYLDTAAARHTRNRDIDAPFVQQVLAIEHAIIAPQARLADVLISRDYQITLRR